MSLALRYSMWRHSDPERSGNSERKSTLKSSSKIRCVYSQNSPSQEHQPLFSARKCSYPVFLGAIQCLGTEGEQSCETPLKLSIHFWRCYVLIAIYPKLKLQSERQVACHPCYGITPITLATLSECFWNVWNVEMFWLLSHHLNKRKANIKRED